MQDLIIQSLMQYYGLDWLALASGLAGMILIARKDRNGFLLCCLSSFSGVAVAVLSLQFGYIAYNLILISIMAKAYYDWGRIKSRVPGRNEC